MADSKSKAALAAIAAVLCACAGAAAPASTDAVAQDTVGHAAGALDAKAPDAHGPATPPAELYAELTGSGPHHVGFRIVTLTYTLPAGLGARSLPLHLWYPTAATAGEHPTYFGIFADPESILDAPLVPPPTPGGYPVLVHSHGYMGFAGNSSAYMRHLASHGWVVAAPEHVGNTLGDTPTPLPLLVSLQRPLDIGATLDWLAKTSGGDALAGKVDMAHVGMSGHSFGTYTTWIIAGAAIDKAALQDGCAKKTWQDCTPALLAEFQKPLGDKRVKTILALAGDGGGLVHNHGIDAVKIPVLQMNGTLDDAGETALYKDATAVDLSYVTVAGGCHQLYGLGNVVMGAPGCAALPNAQGFALARPWLLAWLRRFVLDDKSPAVMQLTTGQVLNDKLVTFQHKGP